MPGKLPHTNLTLAEKTALLKKHGISIRGLARELGKSHVLVLKVLRGESTSEPVMKAVDAKVAKLLAADRRKSKKGK